MGNYKQANKNTDCTLEERMYPEPEYQIMTRPPCRTGNSWKKNIRLRIRQEQMADQAMPVARRKCFDPSIDYIYCANTNGLFWVPFNCQEEYYYLAECQEYEYYVEMDKRRRDITRNHQKWWRQLYDQHGEVGKQKQMPAVEFGYWDSMKWSVFGDRFIDPEAYKENRPKWFKG